jgi:hypothetical protein
MSSIDLKLIDLRIGNYLKTKENAPVKRGQLEVYGLDSNKNANHLDLVSLGFVNDHDFFTSILVYLEGIELTEQLILDLGFEFYKTLGHYRIVIDDVWFQIYKTNFGFKFTFVNLNEDETKEMPRRTVTYIHELQNLMFVLSNQELKFKK